MNNKREAGVLMHITSLPSPFGVGVFGEETKRFIKFLSDMKFTYWQVLPFVPTDSMNSPYCSPSSFAGNELFIDPRLLVRDGLCSASEAEQCRYNGSPFTADFSFASQKREELLKIAFAKASDDIKDASIEFARLNRHISDYAYYTALKRKYGGKAWFEWDRKDADFNSFSLSDKDEISDEYSFICFKQYLFFRQWAEIRKYAEENNVKIIGDMPIYVALDSADVWANRECFEISEDTFAPSSVAGVPPDYFSEDGQLWGNPLYNWDELEKDGYKWWLARLGSAFDA